jgi:hypothetical protein
VAHMVLGRGLPPPLHSSVRQVPVLFKPQCMLLRNLVLKNLSAGAPGAAKLQCALKGGRPLVLGISMELNRGGTEVMSLLRCR